MVMIKTKGKAYFAGLLFLIYYIGHLSRYIE
jgi:hypothetical protein